MKKLLKNQKGFTLVELLAVIVILAVIAAIAVPSIGHIISKSTDKAKINDALQIIDAAKLYVADNNVSSTVNITKDKLAPYLNGDSANTNKFTSVDYNLDSAGNATYTINGHDDPVSNPSGGAVSASNSATEQALLDALNPKTTS